MAILNLFFGWTWYRMDRRARAGLHRSCAAARYLW